jgi:NAD+ kinase
MQGQGTSAHLAPATASQARYRLVTMQARLRKVDVPRRVGIVRSPHRAEASALAEVAASVARARGLDVWEASTWDLAVVGPHLGGTDVVLCFGGDGTLIRAARAASPLAVPVAGVNLGRVGFLAEFAPEDMDAGWSALLDGRYWIEERVTLHIDHQRAGARIGSHLAINDAVVGRGPANHIVRLHTWVGGQYLTSFAADGLLIATPTGSTGSNLAAGGPVLPPDMAALVLTPVLPFVSFRNPLVFAAPTQIDVQVSLGSHQADQEAALSVDGQQAVVVKDGDRLTFRCDATPARFARVRPQNYFHASLVPKLQRGTLLTPLPPDTPSPEG